MLDHAHDLLEGAKDRNQFVYKASVHSDWMEYAKEKYGYKWKPSIFMPKEAARIFLRVTDLRLERLHDISEEDAIAEGCPYGKGNGSIDYALGNKHFPTLWANINGEKNWDDNPYVWVISFEKIKNEFS